LADHQISDIARDRCGLDLDISAVQGDGRIGIGGVSIILRAVVGDLNPSSFPRCGQVVVL
jgi:hypothetical protein